MAYEQAIHPRIQQAVKNAYLLSEDELEQQLQMFMQIRESQSFVEAAVSLGNVQLAAAQDYVSNYLGNYRQAKFQRHFSEFRLKYFNFVDGLEDGVELEISRVRIRLYRLSTILGTQIRKPVRDLVLNKLKT